MKFSWLVLAIVAKFAMSSDPIVVEITVEGQRCELGEGPHWDIERQSLYYIDIVEPSIQRYDSQTGEIFKAFVDGDNKPIGFAIPVDGTTDEFIIGAGRRLLLIKWDGKSKLSSIVQVLGEVDSSHPGNRINDAKVDPSGRFLYLGSMGDESNDLSDPQYQTGVFYRYAKSSGFVALKNGVGISNGLCWNEKLHKFYYIDSVTKDIKEFNYNPETGDLSNEKILITRDEKFTNATFAFDGMTIDADGNLYVATWGGSKVFVVNPQTKEITRVIEMPTKQVTSLAFGGPKLDVLYVTTAGKPKPQEPPAGGLFKITGLGAKGLPMTSFKLN